MWLSSALNRLRELDFVGRSAGGNDHGRELVGRKDLALPVCPSRPRRKKWGRATPDATGFEWPGTCWTNPTRLPGTAVVVTL